MRVTDEPETQDAAPERFVIDTPEKADWAADIILTAEERLARIRASSAAAIAEAERDLAAARDRFAADLELWAKANLPYGKRGIALPRGGRLQFRAVPAGLRVADEAAARAWAHRRLPDAIRVKVTTSVSATALKEYAQTTGELPDGVERTDPRDDFSVVAPKGGRDV